MKFTIDRARWWRGRGFIDSRLVRAEDGRRCCLGFYSLACGYTEKELEGISSPSILFKCIDISKNLFHNTIYNAEERCDTEITKELIRANDYRHIDDVTRENTIAALFKEAGIDVEFVN